MLGDGAAFEELEGNHGVGNVSRLIGRRDATARTQRKTVPSRLGLVALDP
ncbi:hypothetical protein DSM104329_05052 [Capillimicrobium parvum]|uniref:Uncharacterized protein n=1 Tax=Capillimicrobium parvum TaxID=2884022 RepID=A0A9E7C5P6_9ACTN|nr:hypothetical protein DSM104329_05052 [Capillimicrobium parvum]